MSPFASASGATEKPSFGNSASSAAVAFPPTATAAATRLTMSKFAVASSGFGATLKPFTLPSSSSAASLGAASTPAPTPSLFSNPSAAAVPPKFIFGAASPTAATPTTAAMPTTAATPSITAAQSGFAATSKPSTISIFNSTAAPATSMSPFSGTSRAPQPINFRFGTAALPTPPTASAYSGEKAESKSTTLPAFGNVAANAAPAPSFGSTSATTQPLNFGFAAAASPAPPTLAAAPSRFGSTPWLNSVTANAAPAPFFGPPKFGAGMTAPSAPPVASAPSGFGGGLSKPPSLSCFNGAEVNTASAATFGSAAGATQPPKFRFTTSAASLAPAQPTLVAPSGFCATSKPPTLPSFSHAAAPPTVAALTTTAAPTKAATPTTAAALPKTAAALPKTAAALPTTVAPTAAASTATSTNTVASPCSGNADYSIDEEMMSGFKVDAGIPLLTQVRDFVGRKLVELEKVPVKIAVAGEVKAGKSTLINTLRGLKYDPLKVDKLAAKVGVQECTSEPTVYQFPGAPRLNLVDLPGINTPSHPAETYKDEVKLTSYDMVLIVFKETVHQSDLILASILKEAKVPFWFIRTQIDIDLEKHRKLHFKGQLALTKLQVQDFMEDTRKNLHDNLPGLHSDSKFFIVEGELTGLDKYDMPALKEAMAAALTDKLKKQALILHMRSFLPSAIEEKCAILSARIKWFALSSSVVALAPIPGLSSAVDIGAITSFTKMAANSLGINPDVIQLGNKFYRQASLFNQLASVLTSEGITLLIRANVKYIASNMVEEYVRFAIPVIGSILAGAISFSTTYAVMKFILNKLENWTKELAKLDVDGKLLAY